MKFNPNYFVIAGWLIDGSNCKVQKDVVLEISGEKVSGIHVAEPVFLDYIRSQKQRVFDYSKDTVLPALIDNHVHLSLAGTTNPEIRQNQLSQHQSLSKVYRRICTHLNLHCDYGIAAVRDAGDFRGFVQAFVAAKSKCLPASIRLQFCGKGWHNTGRYGRMIGCAVKRNTALASEIENSKELCGGWVKIVNSGLNSLVQFGQETAPQFSRADLRAAVQTAISRGLRVMVHANGKIPVRLAIEAGCHSIEHGFFMGQSNLKRMADKQITWIPTATTMAALIQKGSISAKAADIAKRTLNHQLKQLRLAREYGVPVGLGTDSGSIGEDHGKAVWQEMQLYRSAGFGLGETVKSASAVNAKLLQANDIGTLRTGKQAAFIIISGGPRDILNDPQRSKIVATDGVLYRDNSNIMNDC